MLSQRMRLFIFALALVFTSPALAQESACVSIDNDVERLACYDAANGRTPRTAQAVAQSAVASLPEAERRGLFPNLFAAAPVDFGPAETLQVARFARRANGPLMLVMSNDEVWAPTETPERMPAVGETVSIQRETVGQYVLTPQTGAPFRVRRQN